MSILSIVIAIFGAFAYLYFFWNRLKEDYTSNVIFSIGFYILIGSLLLYLVTRFLVFPKVELVQIQSSGILFWASFLGASIGYLIGILQYHLRFFESLEAFLVALLYILLAVFVADTFASLSLASLIGATVVSLLITLFYFIESRYRDFTWYKSGKVGFSGLTTIGIFFLIRSFVAIWFPFVLTFLGKMDSIVSGILTFFLFLGVYNLSQQK